MTPSSPAYRPAGEKIHHTLNDLAIPRMIGTDGEKFTQTALYSKLKKIQFKPIAEPFIYYLTYSLLFKVGILLSLILTGVIYLSLQAGIYWVPLLLLLVLGIFTVVWAPKYIKDPQSLMWGAPYPSKNIVGERLCSKREEFDAKMGLVLIVSHYDSIGNRYFGSWYRWVFRITLFLGGSMLGLTILLGFWAFWDTSSLPFMIFRYVALFLLWCFIPGALVILPIKKRIIRSELGIMLPVVRSVWPWPSDFMK